MRNTNSTSKTHLEFSDILACSFHDIKNSLELLAVTLDSLSENLPKYPEKRDDLTCVQYEVLRISNTLTYMLTVYKMEQQQFTLDLNYHSVFELMEETYYKYRLFTQTRGISMEINCPEDLVWCFDRNLIAIILDETINNSCRYSQSRLVVSANADEDYLTLVVEDDGVGYPEELIRDFSPSLSPIDTSRLRSNRTGLGMYFAKSIVENHTNKLGGAGYMQLSNGGQLGGGKLTLVLPV